MIEEYLDILDENGNLTGAKELRSVVHEKGLWHRTVSIYCYRFIEGKLELIVHLRSKSKSHNPDKWAIGFGGHVESGSDLKKTLASEMLEETGISIDEKSLMKGMHGIKYDGGTEKEFTNSYYYKYEKPVSELTFNDREVQEAAWMSFEEIIDRMRRYPEQWTGSIKGLNIIKEDLLSKI